MDILSISMFLNAGTKLSLFESNTVQSTYIKISIYSAVRLKWTLWDQRKVFTLSKVHFIQGSL